MASRELVLMVKHRMGLCAIKSAKDWSFDDFLSHAKKSNISSNSNLVQLQFKYDIDGYIGCSLNSPNDWSSLMCLVQLLDLNIVNVTCYDFIQQQNSSLSHFSPDVVKGHVFCPQIERESKRHCGVDVDRISNLPDPILCKILSLLPTKNAVATCILSTRWNSVSPFLDQPITVDLDDSFLLKPPKTKSTKPSRSFTIFVEKLLKKTLSGCSVDVMKLKCSKYYDGYKIPSWVDAAVRLKTRELVLSVRLSETAPSFVSSLKGCSTLTRLELGKGFKVNVPEGFKLPNLKVLVLFKLWFCATRYNRPERDMFRDLIGGCPALQDLCLSNCRFPSVEKIEIKSSVLKKLTIKDSLSCQSMRTLDIDVPSLEVLMYDDFSAEHYRLSTSSDDCVTFSEALSFPTFKSLHRAHIDTGRDEPLDIEAGEDLYFNTDVFGIWMVIVACSRTKHLFLATQSISSLQRSNEPLPAFENLTSLALGCVWRAKGWELVAKLLENAPKLEKLTFEEGFGVHKGGYSSFVSMLYRRKPPLCLETRIKEIEFKVFGEEKDEISLVEYFLNNGKVVQKVRLSCLPCKKATTLSRLRLLPQHSKIDFQPK